MLFDPTTHALHPGSNHFQYYDTWNLWPGPIGVAGGTGDEHVRRCLAAQAQLGVRSIVPAPAVRNAIDPEAHLALAMMGAGLRLDAGAIVTVCGTASFWESGPALDAYIGSVAQLRPSEVFVSILQSQDEYPARLRPACIFGVCRSAHALALRSKVTLCHGDFAGLPAVAAGVSTLGTGWDLGQRRLTSSLSVKVRSERRNSQRCTYQGLLASLKGSEVQRLEVRSPSLSHQLVPGAVPADMVELWKHHIATLHRIHGIIMSGGNRAVQVATLRSLYAMATTNFGSVKGVARPLEADELRWIGPFSAGLEAYAASEGL
ncbi:MAG: hypothetical protein KC731_36605 [Myxococcales bacterium]|nr:hypothetical protein [Myxococcales bacterium]